MCHVCLCMCVCMHSYVCAACLCLRVCLQVSMMCPCAGYHRQEASGRMDIYSEFHVNGKKNKTPSSSCSNRSVMKMQ